MAAMTAAETAFPNPPSDQPQWLALAQAVYNTQADPLRHDDTCGGGMRWQIPPWNTGYDYKNAISNGVFINLGARLAVYTGNSSYTSWVEKTWDWVNTIGLMDTYYDVYDGVHIENCSAVTPFQFSYNTAIYLLTAATMYNYTNGSSIWYQRTDGILNRTLQIFFPNNIAYEVTCEAALKCNTDMFSQKAYLTRWMAQTTKMAPFTFDRIMTVLNASAVAAALQCCGGPNGRMCGLSWSKGATWDGTMGVGQQMAALEVIQSNLIQKVKAPVTNGTGGISVGDPSAGSQPQSLIPNDPVTLRDKAGAGVLTAAVLMFSVGVWSWMSF
jgi:mannan endo-1,6-alpha-mannosidase